MDMTFSGMVSETVRSLSKYLQFIRASTSAGSCSAMTLAMSFTKATNRSLLAQKSVSQLTSTTTPTPFSVSA